MSKTRLAIFTLLISISFSPLFSQRVLLEKLVEDSIVVPEHGPNSKRFGHLYYSFGHFNPTHTSIIEMKNWGSWFHEIGWRQKYQINRHYSLGMAPSLSFSNYALKPGWDWLVPFDGEYGKENIKVHTVNAELYNRMNFGKRGNYMGIFMDLGFTVSFNYYNKKVRTTLLPDGAEGKKKKETMTYYENVAPCSASLMARAGVGRFVVWGSYTALPAIRDQKTGLEIKGFRLGLQAGLHR
jgi:hypothetical protein